MSSFVHRLVRPVLRKFGYSVSRYPTQSTRDFFRLLDAHHIDMILDIGANTGQFGNWLLDFGYKGHILSFEPLPQEYNALLKASKRSPLWKVAERCGLGNAEGWTEMNISENSVSSSMLPLDQYTLEVSPSARYVTTQKVMVKRLDHAVPLKSVSGFGGVLLKLDVQGFEDRVLDGADGIMEYIKGILVEFSLSTLYTGQMPMTALMQKIESMGFSPCYFIPHVTTDATGRLLQVDGVYYKL
jgi:FkbM family methyltransferase